MNCTCHPAIKGGLCDLQAPPEALKTVASIYLQGTLRSQKASNLPGLATRCYCHPCASKPAKRIGRCAAWHMQRSTSRSAGCVASTTHLQLASAVPLGVERGAFHEPVDSDDPECREALVGDASVLITCGFAQDNRKHHSCAAHGSSFLHNGDP